jgi:hypothetical protein
MRHLSGGSCFESLMSCELGLYRLRLHVYSLVLITWTASSCVFCVCILVSLHNSICVAKAALLSADHHAAAVLFVIFCVAAVPYLFPED